MKSPHLLILFAFLGFGGIGFGQNKLDTTKIKNNNENEIYDYKYTYQNPGNYYIHGERVTKDVFKNYTDKCDSVLKSQGLKKPNIINKTIKLHLGDISSTKIKQNENIELEDVPELAVVSE